MDAGGASAAERYCVGSTPKARNTVRQAASVGSSLRGVSPIGANECREALDDVRVIAEARHETNLAHEAPQDGSGRPVVARRTQARGTARVADPVR